MDHRINLKQKLRHDNYPIFYLNGPWLYHQYLPIRRVTKPYLHFRIHFDSNRYHLFGKIQRDPPKELIIYIAYSFKKIQIISSWLTLLVQRLHSNIIKCRFDGQIYTSISHDHLKRVTWRGWKLSYCRLDMNGWLPSRMIYSLLKLDLIRAYRPSWHIKLKPS